MGLSLTYSHEDQFEEIFRGCRKEIQVIVDSRIHSFNKELKSNIGMFGK